MGALATGETLTGTGVDLTSAGIGCRFTTVGVTDPGAWVGWRLDHSLMSSITAGSSGWLSTSTVPSACTARGTWVGLLTRLEGT